MPPNVAIGGTCNTSRHDIAADVHVLRTVTWTVPGFNVDAYRDQPAGVHAHIESDGAFVAHPQHFLIEAHRPH